MKILWFTNTGSNFLENDKHNGGGWISSLETALTRYYKEDVNLSIAFTISQKYDKKEKGNVTYYPIYKNKFSIGNSKNEIDSYLKIVNDCDPDIIQIFGTEQNYGLIIPLVKKPVVVHIQGILCPYFNALLPPSYSILDFLVKDGYNPFSCFINFVRYRNWKKRADLEFRILGYCKYIIGRTEWDKNVTTLLSPDSEYFYCSEILRDIFYKNDSWESNGDQKKVIVSTLSSPLYKGADLVLKTSNLLKNILKIDFEWNVYGVNEASYAERKTGIKAKNVNVFFRGVASAETLKTKLLKCDAFVHPSYIDNSPNSVCEAQIIGVPVLACYVGGLPSIIEDNETGLLVPANDPFILASYINKVLFNSIDITKLSKNGMRIAKARHDDMKITKDLMKIYSRIIVKENE